MQLLCVRLALTRHMQPRGLTLLTATVTEAGGACHVHAACAVDAACAAAATGTLLTGSVTEAGGVHAACGHVLLQPQVLC